MQIVLLSGGSGKRLWPLSNDVRSKQFIKIFNDGKGNKESMVQRMYREIRNVIPEARVTIATGKSQVSAIQNQLGEYVNICVEPARRDTFPAIALACMYLKDVCEVSLNEAVVVCPVDPFVNSDYFETVKKIGEEVDKCSANITLMGIKPTYPSEKYGYIVPEGDGNVKEFKEKPDLEGAKKLLEQGALWNGGMFGFKLGYMVDKAHELLDFADYQDLKNSYETATKISIDYAVVEKEKSIKVISFDGEWMDVGTWKTLTMVMEDSSIGEAVMDDTCENTHILNEMNVPILAMGLKNVVIAASPDGILVADKDQSSYMKPYVDKIQGPVMFAEKSWGSYRVMDIEESSLTVKVTLLPGHEMNYHSHSRRDEIWTVIEGEGVAILDGKAREVDAGDTIMIPRGLKHTIKAKTLLKVMEVQVGNDIDVEDKEKFEL